MKEPENTKGSYQSDLSWSGRMTAAHWIVVLLSLVLTLGAWQYSKRQIEGRIQTRYETERDRVVRLISVRMEKYEEALWSGVAAMYSHGEDMSHDDWASFSASLSIEERYPGINGIGVIHYVERDGLASYLAEQRETRPDFRVHPEHDLPYLMPITHIQPVATNAQAVGLDVAHETNRRTALLKSRDTGTAQITGPIVLVQDAAHTPGFLFYAPYYRSGDPDTAMDREDWFLGAVYAPFVVSNLMEGVLSESRRHVSFSIRDAGELIYDEGEASGEYHDPDPQFSETVSLDLYGRTWELDIRTNMAFRANNFYAQPEIILVGGLLIDGLLLSLFALMSNANHRATRYAENLHGELRQKTERLEESNAELERIVYFASHDLKTPIRGIGGLTEMILDDLQDYLASDGADPEVEENLRMILDRVGRMERLAREVLEYSGMGYDEEDDTSLEVSEVLASITVDLGLRPDQLRASDPAVHIGTDHLGFRRVLENLIGNAVKYHPDPEQLEVAVEIEQLEDSLRFTVRDNGPGIDEAHHDRIFDLFQKIGTDRAVESTGIGLAIVRKTVEMHGGKISVASSLGKGASFIFDWPRSTPPALHAAA